MKSRERFPCRTEQSAGKWQAYRFITCCQCGYDAKIKENTNKSLPIEFLSKKFREWGWDVGQTAKGDVCPRCVAGKKPMSPASRRAAFCAINNVARLAPAAIPAPAPIEQPQVITMADPRQPTREDRRAILDSIEEHWNHERNCYRQAFSDKALGAKLNKPAAWVSDIRDEFFGPDTNEARDEAIATLQTLEKDTKAAADRLLAAAQEAETLNRKIVAELAKLLKAAA